MNVAANSQPRRANLFANNEHEHVMPSNESPSFFKISGTEFDGTTLKSTAWQPSTSPKSQPSNYLNQTIIGRLSFADLGQPGSLGQLAIARCDTAASLMTLAVKTLSAAENTAAGAYVAVPAPNNLDATLYTRTLTPDWCLPFLMGPTDAIALTDGLVSGIPATVEIMTVDLQDAASLAYLNALFTAASITPAVAVRIVTATEVIAAFSGTQYILGTAAAVSMNLTLPLASAIAEGTTLVVTRINGGWIAVLPQGADTINGATTSVIASDLGQTTFVLRGGRWLASDSPTTATIAVANAVNDAVVAVPIVTGSTVVNVDFTARGQLQMPVLANVAIGTEYLIVRTSDGAGFSPVRAEIIMGAPGDLMNGLANGVVQLGNVGAGVRFRRVALGWLVTSDRISTPAQNIASTGNDTLDSLWAGLKTLVASQAAAQTLTLPAANLCVAGGTIHVLATGAGGLTVTSPVAAILGSGANVTSLSRRLSTNESGTFTWNGTNWVFIRSAPTVQTIAEPADRIMTETWNGLRIFRCTQAGAQLMTLPAATAVPIGMEAHFVSLGAGGLTVSGGGTNLIGAGASAATKAIAINTCIRVVSDGTNWLQTI